MSLQLPPLPWLIETAGFCYVSPSGGADGELRAESQSRSSLSLSYARPLPPSPLNWFVSGGGGSRSHSLFAR
ncbi:hypothetical protein XENTR_v10002765 [Xenopus tropicalis]|nr:hypothetical protein XENTR_v10002765 [Xenopus tropicalis]